MDEAVVGYIGSPALLIRFFPFFEAPPPMSYVFPLSYAKVWEFMRFEVRLNA